MWRQQWPQVCKRLREDSTSFADQSKRRRLGLRQGEKQQERPRTHVRAVENFLQKLLVLVHPARLEDTPSEATLARVGLARDRFGHVQALRRLARQHAPLPVHPALLALVTSSRRLNEEQALLWRAVAARYKSKTNRFLHKETFLVCVEQLQRFRREREYPQAALCLLGELSLADARRFCLRNETLRCSLLLCTGFGPEDELLAQRRETGSQRPESKKRVSIESRWREASKWHADVLDEVLAVEKTSIRSSFPDAYLRKIAATFCRFMFRLEAFLRGRRPLQSFLREASSSELAEAVRWTIRQVQPDPKRTKGVRHQHHGMRDARQALHFLRGALASHLACSLESFTPHTLLQGVPNARVVANPDARRVFTDEEVEALFNVARDPAEVLMLTLLHEIGLRSSAIAHLRYSMLLDDNHVARKECRVPEKGGVTRSFLTSPNLQNRIQALANLLRDRYSPERLRNCYPLNLSNIDKPSLPLYWSLRAIASRAGIEGPHVHPHSFRHRLVGKLAAVGNPLELVSKFMGHRDTKTTAVFYWVPTLTEIANRLIDPWTAPRRKEEEAVSHEQLLLCRELLTLSMECWDADTRARVLSRVPEFQAMLADILT